MQFREMRLRRGWSQEGLAERSGLSVRTIQRVENGETPGARTLTALAAAFDVDVEMLVATGEPQPVRTTLQGATRSCLAQYAEFDGETGRGEYWWFFLFVVLAGSAATLVSEVLGSVVVLALALPLVAAGARRLHDTGRSGWWQLLALVPFGGVVPLILLARPAALRQTTTVPPAVIAPHQGPGTER